MRIYACVLTACVLRQGSLAGLPNPRVGMDFFCAAFAHNPGCWVRASCTYSYTTTCRGASVGTPGDLLAHSGRSCLTVLHGHVMSAESHSCTGQDVSHWWHAKVLVQTCLAIAMADPWVKARPNMLYMWLHILLGLHPPARAASLGDYLIIYQLMAVPSRCCMRSQEGLAGCTKPVP